MFNAKFFWSRGILLAGLAAGFSPLCRADTVYLKNGTEVEGTVTEDNNNTIVVKMKTGVSRSYRRIDVDTIVYDRKRPDPAPARVEAPRAEPAAPPPPEAKTGAVPPAKPGDAPPADAAKGGAPAGDAKAAGGEAEAKGEAWTAPPGLAAFPKNAKRMSKAKEDAFMDALEKMASMDEAVRRKARDEIAGFGTEGLPYLVAGIQHVNVEARSGCMALIGQVNGRTAVKQVIEVFFSAMPEEGEAATYQVPFIRAVKTTLPAITGQTFINVEPDKSMVQDGLKRYVAWYNENYDRLPAQLGEEKIEPTDPEYAKKLKKARDLVLAKKSWPRPALPSDMVSGPGASTRPAVPPGATERPADEAYRDGYSKVSRDDALKRPQDK